MNTVLKIQELISFPGWRSKYHKPYEDLFKSKLFFLKTRGNLWDLRTSEFYEILFKRVWNESVLSYDTTIHMWIKSFQCFRCLKTERIQRFCSVPAQALDSWVKPVSGMSINFSRIGWSSGWEARAQGKLLGGLPDQGCSSDRDMGAVTELSSVRRATLKWVPAAAGLLHGDLWHGEQWVELSMCPDLRMETYFPRIF